jgi:GT2 family glycosyltransferase
MRVAALKDVGGYDSRYSIGAEDEDLANRIIEMFGESSIYFDPSLIVTHSSDGRIRSFIKRSFKYGRSAGLRYCLEGGLPTVMPIPALLISLFILGLITMGNKISIISIISLLILILIPILYVARSRSIKYFLLDGYLLFISEVAHLCGFFMFLVQHNKSKVFELSNS